MLLNHGLQRVLTTHHPLLPSAELLILHGFFQAQGSSFQKPTSLVQPGEKGGEHRVIKALIMKEALSRWSQTHIRLYFTGKKHLLFEIQVTKLILSEHWGVCYSTQVLCHSPAWVNKRTMHLESCYKCLNQNTLKDIFYSTLAANWTHFLKHRSQEVLNRVTLSCSLDILCVGMFPEEKKNSEQPLDTTI